ncbi:MAG: hypothetical protein HYY00_08600 [Chloroflexi bacterium]|nr:hypothetical protein [Chloroflexota bacterium]
MYTVAITVPSEHSNGLLAALSKETGARLDITPEGPVTLVLEVNSISVVDGLKVWLDAANKQGGNVRLRAGPHLVDMSRFCRLCQVEEGGTPRDFVLPCPPPAPTAREYCPLVFLLQQADQEAEPKATRRTSRRAGTLRPELTR